ncbi:MAG: bis(5'-nucleosyl)-tetraphosphatase [Gammaproteobacteria bacterium]|jgi:bis(5'-nucleosidyl)-tetraphosphatase
MSSYRQRLSAGVVVVREVPGGVRYLLLRAFRYWDFPKGMVENGETPLQAARREVSEETTIHSLEFAWGKGYRETPPYNRGKVARYYLARTDQDDVNLPVNPLLGRPEHSEYRWVDYTEACRLVTPRVRAVLDWAADIVSRAKPAT